MATYSRPFLRTSLFVKLYWTGLGRDCKCRRQKKDLFYENMFSYLYPDGRSINPDLSWAVQATPEDHVKVVKKNYLRSLNDVILGDTGAIRALL